MCIYLIWLYLLNYLLYTRLIGFDLSKIKCRMAWLSNYLEYTDKALVLNLWPNEEEKSNRYIQKIQSHFNLIVLCPHMLNSFYSSK